MIEIIKIDENIYELKDGTKCRYIKEVDNRYIICEDGRIISCATSNIKFIKPSVKNKKYIGIVLRNKEKKPKAFDIHRLVGLYFVKNPEPETKKELDHIDGNKLNNHYTNLRWCTNKENIQYYHANKNNMTIEEWSQKKENENRKYELKQLQKISNKTIKRINKKYKLKYEPEYKKVKINGIEFESIYSATQMIYSENPEKNKNTIRTEIRKIINGKQKPYTMYNKYRIEPV